jgi:hypothetical protein
MLPTKFAYAAEVGDNCAQRIGFTLAVLWGGPTIRGTANMLAVARVRRGRALVCSRTPLRFRLLPTDFLAALLRARVYERRFGVLRFQPTEAGRDRLEGSLKAEVNMLAA